MKDKILTINIYYDSMCKELFYEVNKISEENTFSDISKELTRSIVAKSDRAKRLENDSKILMEIRGLVDKL